MGSGAETAQETVRYLNKHGEKVGVVTVHLFRPFSVEHFLKALPPTVKKLAVLDRTKEPGSAGEPLYLDVLTAISEKNLNLKVIGGRYGLSSKEFTPGMVKAIFAELNQAEPKNHFTIGINDDITNTSLAYETDFSIEDPHTVKCVFWGLGSDGTVGANKNSIKIIGEETANHAQGYFVYDSKKSGSVTISHLRFGAHPIHAPYLISQANFTACHQFGFLERLAVLKGAAPGGVFLLNSPYSAGEVWNYLPYEVQKTLIEKNLRFYVINAEKVAKDTGMGGRINSIMQTAFFALSGVLPRERAIHKIKESIKKSYGKRGTKVIEQNYQAVDQTLAELYEVPVPAEATSTLHRRPIVPAEAPEFVQKVLAPMLSGEGDILPVSFLPDDGTYPSGTSKWERRNISPEIPAWDTDLCIQCGKCVMVCPHAVIRHKVYDQALLASAPAGFSNTAARFKEFSDKQYTLQVAPEDCTGCGLCVEVCPVKDKLQVGRKALNMVAKAPLLAQEKSNWDFFLNLPEADRTKFSFGTIKNSQLLTPLFEFSGACAGCGETPYIKLVTQLFGDRAIIANATGCSSIFGGNLPTTPWTHNREGRGPAWSNSLFEDNAEFGLGMRVTLDKQLAYAKELLPSFTDEVGEDLVTALLNADQSDESGIQAQRERVQLLKERLVGLDLLHAKDLLNLADGLVKRSVWLIGGDGWAYDIGYGGLDHVLASGRNVNVLVLDTEVYSNTGGQASKATPRGAVAKFAFGGKMLPKKDLGLLAMTYGYIYVARVAMGANDQQTLNAFLEAEAYNGPSLIIAYSHCIAHGIEMRKGLDQQKRAVQSGLWNLFRYNPALASEGKNPLIFDSKEPALAVEEYLNNETRYQTLLHSQPEQAEKWLNQIKQDAQTQRRRYLQMQQLFQP
jgi:pyruvate-ferredoxin/flavodoxin oxidoreductase